MQQQGGRLAVYEQMMGQGTVSSSPDRAVSEEPELYPGQKDELGEKEMFRRLIKPRVRYDVEVVTKLVVYAGSFGPFPPFCLVVELRLIFDNL